MHAENPSNGAAFSRIERIRQSSGKYAESTAPVLAASAADRRLNQRRQAGQYQRLERFRQAHRHRAARGTSRADAPSHSPAAACPRIGAHDRRPRPCRRPAHPSRHASGAGAHPPSNRTPPRKHRPKPQRMSGQQPGKDTPSTACSPPTSPPAAPTSRTQADQKRLLSSQWPTRASSRSRDRFFMSACHSVTFSTILPRLCGSSPSSMRCARTA